MEHKQPDPPKRPGGGGHCGVGSASWIRVAVCRIRSPMHAWDHFRFYRIQDHIGFDIIDITNHLPAAI